MSLLTPFSYVIVNKDIKYHITPYLHKELHTQWLQVITVLSSRHAVSVCDIMSSHTRADDQLIK